MHAAVVAAASNVVDSFINLAGPQNQLGDYLSRAVELPTEAWERVGAGADTEDRFAFPFLHVWPGIWSETIRHHTTEEIIFLCLQQVDSIDGEACGVDTSSLLSSAQIEERRSEARAQTADELEDCQPHNAFRPHELALLGLTQHSFVTDAVFEESQYVLCPQFGSVYRQLRYSTGGERQAALCLKHLQHVHSPGRAEVTMSPSTLYPLPSTGRG